MPDSARYRFCPMCRADLVKEVDRDGIDRARCSSCAWIYFPSNLLGVNIVPVTDRGQIAVILPPDAPLEAPVALPGGVVEYGETPEQAAIRETLEETGFPVRLTCELGRWFNPRFPYGPMLSFMYQADVVGGDARASHEGNVALFTPREMPPISPTREGSARAFHEYTARLG